MEHKEVDSVSLMRVVPYNVLDNTYQRKVEWYGLDDE